MTATEKQLELGYLASEAIGFVDCKPNRGRE
jgi:hypothetical protein